MKHHGSFPPYDGRPWQTQRTKRQTNERLEGRTDEKMRLFVRPSLRLLDGVLH